MSNDREAKPPSSTSDKEAPPKPDRAARDNKKPRLAPLPAEVDLGEQVVGSYQVYEVATLAPLVREPFGWGQGDGELITTIVSAESTSTIEHVC